MGGSSMRGFDVLAPDLDMKQHIFIEASAGTGKTYTLENLVLRLVKEGVPLSEILVMTFTKAATLELKIRIREKLRAEKMHHALAAFEEARIYTIHSFCWHTLQEHAYELGLCWSREEEGGPSCRPLQLCIRDLLRDPEGFSPRQLEILFSTCRYDVDVLIDKVLHQIQTRVPIQKERTYEEIMEEIELPSGDKLVDYARSFKKMMDRQKRVKPEVEEALLKGELVGSPLIHMTPENLLKGKSYPEELVRCVALAQEASDPLRLFARFAESARGKVEELIEEKGLLYFEDLVLMMRAHVPQLAPQLRKAYQAVLIDEFQDTNPLQFDIFSELFLHPAYTGALFLVGDPKQAIYRFRHADIYTYLKARGAIRRHESLLCNWRSEPNIITTLNALFSSAHVLFELPKEGGEIIYEPVDCDPSKEEGGEVLFFTAESEELIFHHTLHKLTHHPLEKTAVLVKDRYQADRFAAYCDRLSIPYVLKRARKLIDSEARERLIVFLKGVLNPRDTNMAALNREEREQLFEYHEVLMQKGILALFKRWMERTPLGGELFEQMLQLVEHLAERRVQPDYLLSYLVYDFDPDLEAVPFEERGIQVMTIHVSKGLEFDYVVPLGLMKGTKRKRALVFAQEEGRYVLDESAQKVHQQESSAEKMRQLYVAMTRAKKGLYVPFMQKTPEAPITLFIDKLREPLESLVTVEYVKQALPIQPAPEPTPKIQKSRVLPTYPSFPITSFSSLTPPVHIRKEIASTLPSGAEVGSALHDILEKAPFSCRDFSPYITHPLLVPHKEAIDQMLNRVMECDLGGFTLRDIDPATQFREMEFLYKEEHRLMRGFIDLFFEHGSQYYVIDWKSNLYTDVNDEMEVHNYSLQASIYQEAIYRYTGSQPRCIYVFLRGPALVHIPPN